MASTAMAPQARPIIADSKDAIARARALLPAIASS
jgi:hypothetical protein